MEQPHNQKVTYKNFHFASHFKLLLLALLFISNSKIIKSQTLSAEQIYEKVKDAVVVILAYDYSDELATQGSGVVLNDKGYVVTNYHVLSGNERLEIMHGEEIIPYVDIIGIDVEKDILILKIEEKKFSALKIGDVKKLKVGQRVYAIGSPMGFENTLSEGIISGLRNYDELNKNYVQITASISPGSSGGAVLNDKGELIGISTLTAKEGQNLNFAIPIDDVLSLEISSFSKNSEFKNYELYFKGINAWRNGNYLVAIDFYSLFIEVYPSSYKAYNNRGVAKHDIGDFLGALQDYNESIEINPENSEAYNNRGVTRSELGDSEAAIQDYEIAIRIDPNYSGAYYNLGIEKLQKANYEDAILYFNRAIDNNSAFTLAYLNCGVANARLEDFTTAIYNYNKAINIDPFSSVTYFNRAIAKYNLGDKLGACLDLSKAGELGDTEAYNLIKEFCN